MSRKKKKFGQTTVGKILGGALGLINPALGGLVTGTNDVEGLIQQIKDSNVPTETPNTPNTCLLYTSPSPRDS